MAAPRRRSAAEFFEEAAAETPAAAVEEDLPSSTNHFGPMDLDVALTPEEIGRAQESLYLPNGWYVWYQGKVRVMQFFQDQDKQPTDKRPSKGRMTFLVSGTAVTLDGKQRSSFNFSISPDYRIGWEGDTRGDGRWKNWGRCTDLFFKLKERQPSGEEGLKELIAMLEAGSYQMYVGRGESGNYLSQLKKFA